MTTPPPPWEAHPPLEDEEGFFGAEPRPGRDEFEAVRPDPEADEDTGPIRTVSVPEPAPEVAHDATHDTGWTDQQPPVAQSRDDDHDPYGSSYAERYVAPLSVDPRTVTVRHGSGRSVPPAGVLAAAVAGVVLVVLAAWLLWPSGDEATQAATPAIDSAALGALKDVLPAGYPSEACQPVEAPDGATAKVECTKNTDVGGPPKATYTLMKNADALKQAMDDLIADAGIVNCPGNIQSPGPWRRNATPTKVAGNLVCGLPQGKPMVAWTNDANLVLNVTKAGPEGPTLDQLYQWWSNHS